MRHPVRPSLLVLLVGACVAPEPQGPVVQRGESPLVAAFEEASAESGVPTDLLLAVGYSESRFSQRAGQPSVLRGYGVMHLREGSTLEQGAARAGVSPEALKGEARTNIRGAALVLAELAGTPPATLAGWRPVLERYCGLGAQAPGYAHEVLAVLAHGAHGTDDQGLSLIVPAHPELTQTDLGGGLAQQSFEARPDYPAASWVGPSPNSSSRSGTKIDMVVIHTCQGGFSGCVSWLLNPAAQASAHYVVSSGGTVDQLVEESLKAWHATCVNPRSVGIEHEGYIADPEKWFTEAMYCSSAKLVRSICDRNGIPCDRAHVIGHKEANDLYCGPGHTDPGPGWNWTKFMGYVQNGCGGTGTGRLLGYVYKAPTNDAASRLAGATVKLSTGATATSDGSGLYSFNLPAGTYTATASFAGYQAAAVTRAVAAGADTWGSIGVEAGSTQTTGQYYGSVYEVNPANPADLTKKLPGATVTLDTGASTTARPTDAIFKFDAVKAGTHTATATLAGYKTNSSTKAVAECADPGTCATWGSIGLSKDTGVPTTPPKVLLTAPADGATLDEAHFDLTGQVDNATDVTTVHVAWAGQSVDAPLGAGASFNVPVQVPPGETVVTVSATNAAGTGTASVTVRFQSGVCGFVFEQDVEGGEAARIGGASVELVPGADLCAAAVATAVSQSPDGTFCVDAAPGDYYLRGKAADHLTSMELVTVSADRRQTLKVGLAKGVDSGPRLTVTDPEPGADGKLHLQAPTVTLVGNVDGMIAVAVTVAGQAVELSENTFTAKDVAIPAGETTLTLEATGSCGEKATLALTVVRAGEAGDAGVADAGIGPVPEGGACGCAAGSQGVATFALFGLAALRRRRRSG